MRTWICIYAVLAVTAAVFSGCLGSDTKPAPATADPALFVDYQRTGGIAGLNDRLVIFDNGIALVQSRTTSREFVLNQSDLEHISELFDKARFTALEGNYTSPRGGADFIQYRIHYRGGTVNTEDTAIPLSLEPVIDEMNRILDSGLGSSQVDLSLPKIGSSY